MKKENPKPEDISLEVGFLKAMQIKKNYDRFIGIVDTKRLIPLVASLLNDYKKYYAKYNKDIDEAEFYQDFAHVWHKKDLDERDLAYYRETVFPQILNSKIENSLYINLLEREANHNIEEIIKKGFDPAAVNEILMQLQKDKAEFDQQLEDGTFRITDVDLGLLDTSTGVEWYLKKLQAGLGSMMPGQFIAIAGDSNTGKSAFCISQTVHTLKKKETRPVLYCTSEDTEQDLVGRIVANIYKEKLSNGFEDVYSYKDKIMNLYRKQYDENMFRAYKITGPKDVYKIEGLIEKYNPRLVIVDMLDKMSASDTTQDLTPLYQRVRGWANSGYPIIGTTQSGNTSYQDKETGEFKKRRHLTDKDMANSKSGKQGAVYCSIMIGCDPDVPDIRYVDTTKEKRGEPVSVTCRLNKKYSSYEELI